MPNIYPPVGFYFSVLINGQSPESAAAFKEVSGISMEMGTEEISEGGNSNFRHRVPTTAKYTNLVLKQGLLLQHSAIANWCAETFKGGLEQAIKTQAITVALLDEAGNPLTTWHFINAWPVNWTIAGLEPESNQLVIESLELAYSYFERK